MRTLFISLTLLGCAVSANADQLTAAPQPTARFGTLRSPQHNPYAKLFEAREALEQAQQQAAQAPKRKSVCGMTIIEADPFFDQKMKVSPPKDPNVRYPIRAVEPSICK